MLVLLVPLSYPFSISLWYPSRILSYPFHIPPYIIPLSYPSSIIPLSYLFHTTPPYLSQYPSSNVSITPLISLSISLWYPSRTLSYPFHIPPPYPSLYHINTTFISLLNNTFLVPLRLPYHSSISLSYPSLNVTYIPLIFGIPLVSSRIPSIPLLHIPPYINIIPLSYPSYIISFSYL